MDGQLSIETNESTQKGYRLCPHLFCHNLVIPHLGLEGILSVAFDAQRSVDAVCICSTMDKLSMSLFLLRIGVCVCLRVCVCVGECVSGSVGV